MYFTKGGTMNRISRWLSPLAFVAALSAGSLYACPGKDSGAAGQQASPHHGAMQGGMQDPGTLLAHKELLGLTPEQVSTLESLQREQEALVEETLSVLTPAQRQKMSEGSEGMGACECPMHDSQQGAGQGAGQGPMHQAPIPK
jgi:hypothetical protein